MDRFVCVVNTDSHYPNLKKLEIERSNVLDEKAKIGDNVRLERRSTSGSIANGAWFLVEIL